MRNLEMVLKRKLNCGFNGFDFLNFPKAPRSSRRKVACKGADDDDDDESQICAIDLLASLAGKLLEESESSSTSTNVLEGDNHNHLGGEIKKEHQDDYIKPSKVDFFDQLHPTPKSTSENTSESCLQSPTLENDCILEQTPISDCKKPLARCENKIEDCDFPVESGGVTEEKGVVKVDSGFEQGEVITDTFSLKNPSQLHLEFPEPVHFNGDVKSPPGTDGVPNGPFEGYGNHYKSVCKDDDENYCNYYKFSEKCKSYRPLTRVGSRRMKKSVMTKYRRAVSRSKCFEDTKTDGCLKALHRKRKLFYGYNPWKHETIYRKRRLSDKGLIVNSDEGLSSESVSNSPQKGESEIGGFSAAIGLHSKDSRVKFSIKSLRIPELFIEVPKTATVGSLKRTVKEAVTALLGGGIRIGVLVQGKKVRDDNNTLSQTGLSCRENLGNLGFTLEPGPEKLPLSLCSENLALSVPTDSTERSAASPVLEPVLCPFQEGDHLNNSGNNVEKNHELVPYQNDIPADEQPTPDSRVLAPVSPLEPEALAIIPVNEKPKRTELSQRRTRRPFSVTEVEALVQAVEELGTGRWRDVKLRSFDNASHRTYVDLKDKWKTLVHTASISPQQRRGEPVPQELLDRVLAAHRHWSQHQSKQNGKHQSAATMVVQSSPVM